MRPQDNPRVILVTRIERAIPYAAWGLAVAAVVFLLVSAAL
jgi:hypothetical protein